MSSQAIALLPNTSAQRGEVRNVFSSVLWVLIAFATVTLGLLVVKPALVRPVFPVAACLVGYWIYKRNESYYLSFLLWVYMLAPLLRRLVDSRTSYQEQSFVLLAPLLLTLLPGMHLRRRLLIVAPVIRTAALVALSGIAFGAAIGMIKHPGPKVILATLTWCAPIVLCVFSASVREREMLGRVLNTTFLWGILIMSVYGMYQFIMAPPWDTYWLRQISAASVAPSFGQPKPMGIRVWSTMNAPGPLSTFLSAALVWLCAKEGFWPLLAGVAGYIVLALTLVRSAWLQTAIALLIVVLASRLLPILKSAASAILVAGLLGLVFVNATHSSAISDRFQSFSSLRSDASVTEREEMYRYMDGLILSTPLGFGLEPVADIHGYPIDSSFIELFYMLGWIGALCYLSGLAHLGAEITLSMRGASKERVQAAAITIAAATQLFTGDVLYRQGGIILWLFAGVWAAVACGLPRPSENRHFAQTVL